MTDEQAIPAIPEYQITKLSLGPNDVLVVRVSKIPTQEETDTLHHYLKCVLGIQAKVLAIGPDVELQVLTQAEIEAAAR